MSKEPIKSWPESSAATISAWDLLGIAPDFTGGKSVDEYMNEQRDRNPE